MMCPKCNSAPLRSGKAKTTQLILDQCSKCKGMWFDKGELSTLLGTRAKEHFVIPKFAATMPDAECPRCNVSLYKFCYPGTLILVDGCRQCEGVWLDNNEWKTISHSRDKSNNITCPKCYTLQQPTESCTKCGIVIAKYQAAADNKKPNSATKTTTTTNNSTVNEQSYAADIPGLKGTLLRMVDSTIKKLSDSIFKQ